MQFEILSNITRIETIAVSSSIRELERLRQTYGTGRWRKLKGLATIQLKDGTICNAELHGMKHTASEKKKLK